MWHLIKLQTHVLPTVRLVCGQEAGLSQREWRIALGATSWVSMELTELSPKLERSWFLAEHVGGALPGHFLSTDTVWSMPS